MHDRRVVVTGIGAVTPLGTDIDTLWANLMASRSGVGYTTIFDAELFPTKIAAEIRDWDVSDVGLDPAEWTHPDRRTLFAIGAAKKAVADSGVLDANLDPSRFGVYLGSGEGAQDFNSTAKVMVAAIRKAQQNGDESVNFDIPEFMRAGLDIYDPVMENEQEPNIPVTYIASIFGAEGPNYNTLTACAASSQAIGESVWQIRQGDADVMIAGGCHSMIHPFGVTGFNLLTALSESNDPPEKASRPFDYNRDGFVLGEGASMLILEEYEFAKKRGAKIYGEVAGYGSTADAFRITDTHPEGRGAIHCIGMAFKDAGITPEQVDYINAHGTSTTVNDKVETLAIKKSFGSDLAYKVPMSSTKSMMGHLIAAAGATEAIVCLLAMQNSELPPTINYETPDPDCDLDCIPNVARQGKVDVALTNSFGFGGQNVSLILKKV